MARAALALVHNIELDTVLGLPLHIFEEALVDQDLEGADDAGGQDQDEVMLCGSKAACADHKLLSVWMSASRLVKEEKNGMSGSRMRTVCDGISAKADI